MPNEAALEFVQPEILQDPLIFLPQNDIRKAEIIMPLSQTGQELYDRIWQEINPDTP